MPAPKQHTGAAAVALALTLGSSGALGQASVLETLSGTTFAKFIPSYANGQLNGCGVEFAAILKDWQYRQGGFIRVGGQFGLMGQQPKIGIILKLVVHDLDPRGLTSTPSAPASAYFLTKDFGTTAKHLVASNPSDTPGGIFSIFQLLPVLEVLVEGLSIDKVGIAFARRKGGQDVQVQIETDVQDTAGDGKRIRSPENIADFYKCATSLSR